MCPTSSRQPFRGESLLERKVRETHLIGEFKLLSGKVQLGPSFTCQVDVNYLVAVPPNLKLLVRPDVEVLALLLDLAHDAPDGQVVQVHLVPVVVLHCVQECLQHPRIKVDLESKNERDNEAM